MISTMRAPIAGATRRATTQLERITFGAAAGLAVSLIYVQALITRAVEPVPTVNALVLLLFAGLGARGWRPALPAGVAWLALMLFASLPVFARRFAQPDDLHLVVWTVASLVFCLVGLATGLAALVARRLGR